MIIVTADMKKEWIRQCILGALENLPLYIKDWDTDTWPPPPNITESMAEKALRDTGFRTIDYTDKAREKAVECLMKDHAPRIRAIIMDRIRVYAKKKGFKIC